MLVLNGLNGIGPVTLRRLLDAFDDDAVAILKANGQSLRRVHGVGAETAQVVANWSEHFDLLTERHRLLKHGLTFVNRREEAFPPLLRELYDPPIGLYFKGDYRPTDRCIAIVGTRHATLYGLDVAKRFGAELTRAGWCVVSGMARGIDSAAHTGALEAGGPTVAVLGCGPDIIYPPENVNLYQDIVTMGAVVSEFRFGTRASKTTFPMRNRLLSGMSRAVVVIESGQTGGSMITAKFAADQGRSVFAVPGRIDQDAARGCHLLIRDGATLVTSAEEIIEELSFPQAAQIEIPLSEEATGPDAAAWLEGLSPDEVGILRALAGGGIMGSDELAEHTGLGVPALSAALIMLELNGRVAKHADGRFEARR